MNHTSDLPGRPHAWRVLPSLGIYLGLLAAFAPASAWADPLSGGRRRRGPKVAGESSIGLIVRRAPISGWSRWSSEIVIREIVEGAAPYTATAPSSLASWSTRKHAARRTPTSSPSHSSAHSAHSWTTSHRRRNSVRARRASFRPTGPAVVRTAAGRLTPYTRAERRRLLPSVPAAICARNAAFSSTSASWLRPSRAGREAGTT